MAIQITPYVSFGALMFNKTTKDECVLLLGEPLKKRTNRKGAEEYEYQQFIVRFNTATPTVRECTLLPYADASIDEIKKLGIGTNAQHDQWLADMKKIFPNVEEGYQLTGVFSPGQPSRFFLNGKSIGDITDPEFGPAFFGIWLHPKTSAPKLRQLLLSTK